MSAETIGSAAADAVAAPLDLLLIGEPADSVPGRATPMGSSRRKPA